MLIIPIFFFQAIADSAIDIVPVRAIKKKLSAQNQFERRKTEHLKSLGAVNGESSSYGTGYGYRLELNDGSTIETQWATALCGENEIIPCQANNDIADSTLCAPAILSLTRQNNDGSQMWEKSYLERNSHKEKISLCNSKSWWFAVYSRWVNFPYDLITSPLYLLPDGKTIIMNPTGRPLFRVNADSGNFVGKVPSNVVIMDAEILRGLKKVIERRVEVEMPYPAALTPTDTNESISKLSSIQRLRTEAFFKYFDQAVFNTKKKIDKNKSQTKSLGDK